MVAGTQVSATIGVGSLCLGGYANQSHDVSVWFTCWLGDVSGVLIVAPFLIQWVINPRMNWTPIKRSNR